MSHPLYLGAKRVYGFLRCATTAMPKSAQFLAVLVEIVVERITFSGGRRDCHLCCRCRIVMRLLICFPSVVLLSTTDVASTCLDSMRCLMNNNIPPRSFPRGADIRPGHGHAWYAPDCRR